MLLILITGQTKNKKIVENNYQEIDDQAGFIGFIVGTHLKTHGGAPDPNCSFCKGFIIDQRSLTDEDYPFSSYKMVILDVSDSPEELDKKIDEYLKKEGIK